VPDYTSGLDTVADAQHVAAALGAPQPGKLAACGAVVSTTLQKCGAAPSITGDSGWLNTPDDQPLSTSSLRGKVVLLDFWAYSCINCQRAIKHVEAWYQQYHSAGLDVIGVHTPEYAFEHVAKNVAAGAQRLGITYPVAIDSDYATWTRFANESWPAEYLIDATGEVRHVSIGEGDYGTTEQLIRQLLTAANATTALPGTTKVPDQTPQSYDQTPETYLGSDRADSFVAGALRNGTRTFAFPKRLPTNAFALSGGWTVAGEDLRSGAKAAIALNFTASDVYLDVGGTGTLSASVNGKTTRYPVSGAPDIYAVVDLKRPASGVIVIHLSPGLQAYSFTFG
jgi:thiol-disulfide isomerase/thioredoxin